MSSVTRRLAASLRPSGNEIARVARAEMDPTRYRSFQPIVAGPVVALAGLAAVAVLGILAAPFRMLRSFRSG